jgi:hypothetical protein
MNGFLPWLVRLTCRARTRDFCHALPACRPSKKYFFFHCTHRLASWGVLISINHAKSLKITSDPFLLATAIRIMDAERKVLFLEKLVLDYFILSRIMINKFQIFSFKNVLRFTYKASASKLKKTFKLLFKALFQTIYDVVTNL